MPLSYTKYLSTHTISPWALGTLLNAWGKGERKYCIWVYLSSAHSFALQWALQEEMEILLTSKRLDNCFIIRRKNPRIICIMKVTFFSSLTPKSLQILKILSWKLFETNRSQTYGGLSFYSYGWMRACTFVSNNCFLPLPRTQHARWAGCPHIKSASPWGLIMRGI